MFKKLLKIFVFYYWPFVNWAIFKKVHFLDLKKLSIFSYNVLQCNVYQMYYYIKEICKLHPLIYKTCQKLFSLFSYATKYYFRRVSQKLPKMPGGTCFYFRYLSKACGFFFGLELKIGCIFLNSININHVLILLKNSILKHFNGYNIK